jgi:uncharacterized protein YoxC
VPPWLSIVIALCLIAVTAVLVPAVLALRRVAVRTERVLAIVESDLRPTLDRAQALVEELQALSKDVRVEVESLGALTRRVSDLARGSAQLISGLAWFTRAGRLMGVAAGLKTGLDVFLGRLRRR